MFVLLPVCLLVCLFVFRFRFLELKIHLLLLKPRAKHFNTTYHNIVGHSISCAPLATLLRRVATCWVCWVCLKMVMVDVTCCYSRLARFVQQCCTRACALVQFSILNMSQNVATGWPNARSMLRPTMLRYDVKCI